MSKKLDQPRVVFSTNPNFKPEEENNEPDTLATNAQTLYVRLERLKGGKMATVIENFIGKNEDLEQLSKTVKNKCGVGGTVKDGYILLQGEHRDKVMLLLTQLGYKTKKKGG
jgi:translation initiation factor 1